MTIDTCMQHATTSTQSTYMQVGRCRGSGLSSSLVHGGQVAQAPAASPCPSPLTLASSPTELLVRRVAIAHGTANRARTDTTRSPPLISSPPAHTLRSHWSTHACHFLLLGHLLKKPSLTLHLFTASSLKQRRG